MTTCNYGCLYYDKIQTFRNGRVLFECSACSSVHTFTDDRQRGRHNHETMARINERVNP